MTSASPERSAPAASAPSWPLLVAALAFWLVAAILLSRGRYFNQDEFESMHQGWLLHSGKLQYLDFNSNHPPFFFELLARLNAFFSDPVGLLRAGRGLTFVSASVQLMLVWAIARVTAGATAGRWALIVYGTCVTFLEWSIEIRSDALMVPLWLGAILLVLAPVPRRPQPAQPAQSPRHRAFRLLAIGLLLGTAFWVNQKAALLALPVLVLMFAGGAERSWRIRDTGWAVIGALMPTVACLAVAARAGNLDALVRHNFVGAAELTASDPYREFRSMVLGDLVARDTGFVLLILLASGWALARFRERGFRERFVLCAAIWGLATFFMTPGPFHYYMLSVLPLFGVLVGVFLADRLRWRPGSASVVVAFLLLLVAPVARLAKFVAPTNLEQFDVLRLGSALTAPQSPVFDGAGLLVQRPDAYGFHWILWKPELARYRNGELPPVVDTVRAGGARLVLLSYRLDSLPARDLGALRRQFPRLWGPICVPGFDSGARPGSAGDSLTFELWYDGDYEVSPPGAVIDDRAGESSGALLHLAAGIHSAKLPAGKNRLIVRDAAHRNRVVLPAEPADWRVLGRYGYRF